MQAWAELHRLESFPPRCVVAGRREVHQMNDTPLNPVVWHRSPACADHNCVEVAGRSGMVSVRDGKNPDGPVLLFERAEWDAFLIGAKAGAFDSI